MQDDHPPRGIAIELSPDVAREIRQQSRLFGQRQQQQQQQQSAELPHQQQLRDEDEQPKGLHVLHAVPVVTEDEDWECVIPMMVGVGTSAGTTGAGAAAAYHPIRDDDVERRSNVEIIGGGKALNDDNDAAADIVAYDDNEEEEEEDDNASAATTGSSNSSSAALSYTPPSSLPVVLVDVERLTGYLPTTPGEVESLRRTVRTALWGEQELSMLLPAEPAAAAAAADSIPTTTTIVVAEEKEQAGVVDDDETKENSGGGAVVVVSEETMVLARDFEARVTELFATGMARHSDTSTTTTTATTNANDDTTTTTPKAHEAPRHCYIAVEYPEYLCRLPLDHRDNDTDDTVVQVLTTARVWKQLMQPHDVTVVHRLLVDHLPVCSRSLLWKHDMRREIVRLAAAEEQRAASRHQEIALQHWKGGRRQTQLDKLYTVREALQERLQQARDHQARLVQERNGAVKYELQKRRGGGGGLETFDFESTVFAFPDEDDDGANMFLGLKEDDDDEYQTSLLSNDDYDDDGEARGSKDDTESDSESLVDDVEVEEEGLDSVSEIKQEGNVDTHKAKREHRQAAVRKRRQRLGEAAKEAEHKNKLEAAKLEEERVRELCTTHKLRMAMAVTNSLDGKLRQVDELLESLQEEQWADEEAEEVVGTSNRKKTSQDQLSEEEPQLSVLDQILAMILGACPPPEGSTLADHVRFLEQEHRSILEEWKEHFGRLPPALSSSSPPRCSDDKSNEWGESSPKAQLTSSEAPAFATTNCTGQPAPRPEVVRATLGIVDNEEDNWDADDDDADEAAAVVHTNSSSTPTKNVVGLRPGGRS